MQKTKIEWADYVWNPVSGCSKVSAGCKNCYAEAIANRFWSERKFTDVKCHSEKLEEPLRQFTKRPGIVFVNSMSDLFHPAVPDDFIESVWASMKAAQDYHGQTFVILTKRPERMRQFITSRPKGYGVQPNIWLGVSVENQATADERIPLLLATPSARRVISVEPMLERVDFSKIDCAGWPYLYLSDWWIICGGESGKGARPHPPLVDVRDLKEHCVKSSIPFFLKQMWGQKMPMLDGQIWDQKPK